MGVWVGVELSFPPSSFSAASLSKTFFSAKYDSTALEVIASMLSMIRSYSTEKRRGLR